jgi:hypothetical protein
VLGRGACNKLALAEGETRGSGLGVARMHAGVSIITARPFERTRGVGTGVGVGDGLGSGDGVTATVGAGLGVGAARVR